MAKIAAELEQAVSRRSITGASGQLSSRVLAAGEGWTVRDVICSCGPQDRPFDEQHSGVSIAIVAAGSFQYGWGNAQELMTPGSIMLGNPGQGFKCGHEHAVGDRCISFQYSPDYFETIASKSKFRVLRVPPLRDLSPLITRACVSLAAGAATNWEELSIQLAARTVELNSGISPGQRTVTAAALARVTRVLRMIERHPSAGLEISTLAREARLSPFHFLRAFHQVTSMTPHQYVVRSRLREAAARLSTETSRILDIAFDCGFGDVSNFNRAFRAEFGQNPRAYRRLTKRL
ncbi:MAG: AraC family transcriptional regulator [Bryobacteraceae bacterium]